MGGQCLAIAGDLTDATFCDDVVEQTVQRFGKLDILVANAAPPESQAVARRT